MAYSLLTSSDSTRRLTLAASAPNHNLALRLRSLSFLHPTLSPSYLTPLVGVRSVREGFGPQWVTVHPRPEAIRTRQSTMASSLRKASTPARRTGTTRSWPSSSSTVVSRRSIGHSRITTRTGTTNRYLRHASLFPCHPMWQRLSLALVLNTPTRQAHLLDRIIRARQIGDLAR